MHDSMVLTIWFTCGADAMITRIHKAWQTDNIPLSVTCIVAVDVICLLTDHVAVLTKVILRTGDFEFESYGRYMKLTSECSCIGNISSEFKVHYKHFHKYIIPVFIHCPDHKLNGFLKNQK